MANLKIMNYEDKKFDTGIPIEDIEYIDVCVLTGDEVVIIHCKDSRHKFDSADLADNHRIKDYFDASYTVDKSELADWSNRKDSYDIKRWY